MHILEDSKPEQNTRLRFIDHANWFYMVFNNMKHIDVDPTVSWNSEPVKCNVHQMEIYWMEKPFNYVDWYGLKLSKSNSLIFLSKGLY